MRGRVASAPACTPVEAWEWGCPLDLCARRGQAAATDLPWATNFLATALSLIQRPYHRWVVELFGEF